MQKVVIWLTSYNHAGFLRESIESVLNQTYTDYLLYIVDDCSQDDSWEITQSYHDPRIRTIRHKTNMGTSGLSDMLSQLDCEYLAVAHCDDKWMPDKLEKQVAYLDAHPEVAACFTQVEVIDEEGKPLADKQHVYYDIFNQPNRSRNEWLRYFFEYGNCLCHPSLLIRTEAYEKYGLPTNGLSGIPDFVQWIRLCRHAEIWIYPEKLSCFRVRKNEGNTSGDTTETYYRNAIEQFLTMGEYVDLTDSDEFLKAFPEGKKYQINGEILAPFAYARILLDQTDSPIKNLYALQTIYNLFQDKEKREKLKALYGYTVKDFLRDKQREEIFALLPPERFLQTCLYLDKGDGFNENDAIRKKIYVAQNGSFVVQFHFPRTQIRALRFDPDSVFFRKCWEMSAQVEDQPVPLTAEGACFENGADYFYTTDSRYLLLVPEGTECTRVQISGKCSKIPEEKFDEMQQRRQKEIQEEREAIEQERRASEQRAMEHIQHERDLEKALNELTGEIRQHRWKTALKVLLKKI